MSESQENPHRNLTATKQVDRINATRAAISDGETGSIDNLKKDGP
jgi:hypothetical protein